MRHPWILSSLKIDTNKTASVQELNADLIDNYLLKYLSENVSNPKKSYRIQNYLKLLTEFSTIKILQKYTSDSLSLFLQQCIIEVDLALIEPSSVDKSLDIIALVHHNLIKFGERVSERKSSSSSIMSKGLCIKFNNNQYCDCKTCRWKHLCKYCGDKHQPRNCYKDGKNDRNFL